jgi:hypothetical protein
MLPPVRNKRKEVTGEPKQSILDRGKTSLDNSFLERPPVLNNCLTVRCDNPMYVARKLMVSSIC